MRMKKLSVRCCWGAGLPGRGGARTPRRSRRRGAPFRARRGVRGGRDHHAARWRCSRRGAGPDASARARHSGAGRGVAQAVGPGEAAPRGGAPAARLPWIEARSTRDIREDAGVGSARTSAARQCRRARGRSRIARSAGCRGGPVRVSEGKSHVVARVGSHRQEVEIDVQGAVATVRLVPIAAFPGPAGGRAGGGAASAEGAAPAAPTVEARRGTRRRRSSRRRRPRRARRRPRGRW